MANEFDFAIIEKNIIRSFGLVKEEMTEVQMLIKDTQAKNAELLKELNKLKRDVNSMKGRMTMMSQRITNLSRKKPAKKKR